MAKRKVITSSVEVFRVKGESIEIAFNNLKQEHGYDNYHLSVIDELSKDDIVTGGIYRKSRELYPQYINNKISEHSIFGALYNHKPVIKDASRIVKHNVVNKGTKKWVTVNNYVTDTGEKLEHDTSTKAECMVRAHDLALERNRTINVVVGKELEGGEGILYIAEYIPLDEVDDSNVYVFWKFNTVVTEVEEDDLLDQHTEVNDDRAAGCSPRSNRRRCGC